PNYTFKVAKFKGSPDGFDREIWGVNDQLPGPTIHAKEGEKIRIKVISDLGTAPTSIHWHGMHQPGTWQMDGVANVSRPPIPTGESFTYAYEVTPAGTHWYHSHTGVQYGDGIFGPLIIAEKEPIARYDRDQILMINDWFHKSGDVLLEDLKQGKFLTGKKPTKEEFGDIPFDSGLINGKGRGPGGKGPLTIIEVEKGEKIRLRIINASSTYALRFQVDQHPLTVIASDGPAVEPVKVDNLNLAIGERFDALLEADQEGVHWIRAVTGDGNEIRAVLRYKGSKKDEPEESPVKWGEKALTLADLRSRQPVKLDPKPRESTYVLGGTMKPYRWNINKQFFPEADPIELAKDEHVRFVLKNETMMDHPFHLHGHSFYVLGKSDSLNVKDPPLKDTIAVPAKGDMVIQWVARNPGHWFFHCHIEWHLATGMARVIKIQ
ncbi:MAG: multicopper oxidase family protein, partial [Gemmataceae bacterium]